MHSHMYTIGQLLCGSVDYKPDHCVQTQGQDAVGSLAPAHALTELSPRCMALEAWLGLCELALSMC